MDDLLWPRVLAAFGVDASLAIMCGLLLSDFWLGDFFSSPGRVRVRNAVLLRIFMGLLLLAVCAQLLLLAASFTGQTSVHVVMTSMPDVCSTHAGALLVALCGVALGLCLVALIPSSGSRTIGCRLLVVVALCLHTLTGHAASDGTFLRSELLQLIHLLGMAVWSGGVVVSGLSVVPRLQRQGSEGAAFASSPSMADYLSRLSVASTWALGAVLLSGLIKAYLATDGSLHVVRTSGWVEILTIKTAFVALTVLLGARNRWLLRSGEPHETAAVPRVARILRLEALSMLAVLLLSAWLASSAPPLD